MICPSTIHTLKTAALQIIFLLFPVPILKLPHTFCYKYMRFRFFLASFLNLW